MDFLQELFLEIVTMSLTASVVTAGVLLLRLLLCRAPRKYSYLLWGIVLFRLLCPLSLPSDFSALNLTEGWVAEQGRMEYFSQGRPGELSASMALDAGTDGSLPSYGRTVLPSGRGASSDAQEALPNGREASSQALVRVSFQQKALPAVAAAWLLGAAGMAIYGIFTVIRLRGRLACSVRIEGNIYLADHISTPFVLGALRPRIYLPSGLGEQEREYILLHEQCHIRRRDYLVKPLAFLALCLHWFNPLAWLAFCLAGRDMEMSCDEAVVGKMGDGVRRAYAGSLLHLSAKGGRTAAAPLAFGQGDPKKRIKHVMGYQKPAVALSAAATAVLVIAAACLLTNPASGRASLEGAGGSGTEAPGPGNPSAEGAGGSGTEVEAITQAVMEENESGYPEEYDFACCSFAKLGTDCAQPEGEDNIQLVTYYGWALYQRYKISQQGIEDVGGSHIPIALTFEVKDGMYTLREYWRPRDGSFYVTDIREKFPAELAADGIDSQKYILPQMQDCYKQAVSHALLDTDAVIERLLEEIVSGPAISSNPQDYIAAHEPEYRELCYYGDFTVRYCLKRFEAGNETGLKGQVMARACRDLLGPEGEVPSETADGQEWYEALKAHSGSVVEEYLR